MNTQIKRIKYYTNEGQQRRERGLAALIIGTIWVIAIGAGMTALAQMTTTGVF